MQGLLKGRNVGVIAYGQSTAGKTYTIFGEEAKDDPLLSPNKGVLKRFVLDLFKKMAEESLSYEVYASFFEVYIDQIRDLAKLFVEEQNKQSNSCPRKE